MMANNPTHHTKRLSDLINEFQLKQHITSPTRITPSSKTLIDIIMTKASDTKIIASGEQGQIMLANQRVCLHFASLTNQNA
jgi:exoribonuclease R